MIEGPTIGDWTQYGWIPDDVSSFPARIRLRDAAWMVYYESDTVARRERAELQAENAKLRELVSGLEYCAQGSLCDCCPLYDPSGTNHRRCESLERELGIEVDE